MKRKEIRKNKRRRSRRSTKRQFVPPRTLEEFFAMPDRDQEFWSNVGQAVTEVRAGASLRQASHKFDLDQRRIPQAARSALRKLRNGRWVARPNDRLLRVLVIPTRNGLREIGVPDFRQASLLGKYWTAVEQYRDTGDASALREFRGKHIIDAKREEIPVADRSPCIGPSGFSGSSFLRVTLREGGVMRKKLPQRDPESAWVRSATAARRFGVGAQCACGETRPEAFVPNSNPVICAACDRARRGKTTVDNHHDAGRANSPITTPIPVNDHRAVLNTAQYDWPKATLENSTGSPLLARAACVRGFVDTNAYLVDKLLLPHAEFCELLDSMLAEKLGPEWWLNTDLEQFAPNARPTSRREPK